MLKRIDTLMENFTKNKSIISIKNRMEFSKMKHKILDINNSKQELRSGRKIIRKYRLKQRG